MTEDEERRYVCVCGEGEGNRKTAKATCSVQPASVLTTTSQTIDRAQRSNSRNLGQSKQEMRDLIPDCC